MDKPADVVERVALRVMRIRYRYDWTYGLKKEKVMAVDLDIAKAAIAEVVRAMGDVSPGMTRMGTAAISYDGPPPDDATGDPDYADDVSRSYKAMLTAWARENGVG